MKVYYKLVTVSLISLLSVMNLSGCSSLLAGRMPAGSVTMQSAYDNAINGMGSSTDEDNYHRLRAKANTLKQTAPDYHGYTRTADNEINAQFPILPNPSIVLYVYPHEAGEGDNRTPVPGYATAFPLYTRLYYAMPGEVAAQ